VTSGVNPADRATLRLLGSRIRRGRLVVHLPDGRTRVFRGSRPGPSATVAVHDGRLLRRLATGGAIGLADGYVEGEFEVDDLAALIELAALHLEPGERPSIPAPIERAGRAIWRSLTDATSPRGPLRDVVQHYDLGNAFYERWLDASMTYSSAVFAEPGMTLEDAQREKYRRLADAAAIGPGDHVLEIGSGWGGFALHAASLGAEVTTVTVSREQATYVEKLASEHGVADRIEVRLEDFAATTGTYDHVVSIEMIESIPAERWPAFMTTVHDRLAPGGRAALQIITVADRHWASSNANPDFIRRYVFPGGQVPSPGVLRRLEAEHGLELRWRELHGASYARTLRAWRERFDGNADAIAAMGFDERFRRMWRYYLAYCEGGFRAGRVDVEQVVLMRTDVQLSR
jgi:cyclopropane-fatty-acyl-phospholipid synthase